MVISPPLAESSASVFPETVTLPWLVSTTRSISASAAIPTASESKFSSIASESLLSTVTTSLSASSFFSSAAVIASPSSLTAALPSAVSAFTSTSAVPDPPEPPSELPPDVTVTVPDTKVTGTASASSLTILVSRPSLRERVIG